MTPAGIRIRFADPRFLTHAGDSPQPLSRRPLPGDHRPPATGKSAITLNGQDLKKDKRGPRWKMGQEPLWAQDDQRLVLPLGRVQITFLERGFLQRDVGLRAMRGRGIVITPQTAPLMV